MLLLVCVSMAKRSIEARFFFCLPKGRGGSTGYDTAHALHTRADDSELEKENLKRFDSGEGQVVFSVAKVCSASSCG